MANITGTNGDDSLLGTKGDDIIRPLLGRDTVDGKTGIDLLYVDYSSLSGHSNTVPQASFAATATGYAGSFRSGFGVGINQTSVGFSNIERITYNGVPGAEYLDVTMSPDLVGGYLMLDGTSGDDHLRLDLSAFTAASSVQVSASGEATGNRGTFRNIAHYAIVGGAGNDQFTGGDGSDSLTGGAGANILNGGAGGDVLHSTSIDQIDGGSGDDRWDANLAGLAQDLDFVFTGGNGTINGSAIAGIETFDFKGGTGNDTARLYFTDDQFQFSDDIGVTTYKGGSGISDLTLDTTKVTVRNVATINFKGGDIFGKVFEAYNSFDDYHSFSFSNVDTLTFNTTDISDVYLSLDRALADKNIIIDGGGGYSSLVMDFTDATTSVDVNAQANGTVFSSFGGTFTNFSYVRITGGGGSDTLRVARGYTELTGNGGDDILGSVENAILDGGDGNDTADLSRTDAGLTLTLMSSELQNANDHRHYTLIAIENLVGSNFADALTGNDASNTIDGGPGDDLLDGGAGIDTAAYAHAQSAVTVNLAVTTAQNTRGAGLDTLTNFENLTGSAFGDTLLGSAGDNLLDGAGGIDLLSYAAAGGAITISLAVTGAQATGGAGTDTIRNFENLAGSAFNDRLTGDSRSNVIMGGAGDDVLNGGAGIDTVSYADVEKGGVTVGLASTAAQDTRGSGRDTLSGFENLTGSRFDDLLGGSDGNNVIDGGAGNDTYFCAIPLNGGSGRVYIDLTRTTPQDTGAGMDVLLNIENLVGTFRADTLIGNALDNVLTGGSGDDSLTGGGGNDTASYDSASSAVTVNLIDTGPQATGGAGSDTLSDIDNLVGSRFDDVLSGNRAVNRLTGGDGNDMLDGLGGADMLIGGHGNDSYRVISGTETIVEASDDGVDLVRASAASYTLAANVERLYYVGTATFSGTGNDLANLIQGGARADHLIGAGGNDTLDGRGGADTLEGGVGNDIYLVDDAGDLVIEASQAGTDSVRTRSSAYTLTDNVEILTFIGTGGFTGRGNAGANTIVGGAGGDRLSGGGGSDRLTGDAGADHFVIDVRPGAGNLARITDFTPGSDVIELDRSVFTRLTAPGALAPGAFVTGTTALDADDRILYDPATGNLSYDYDGSGAHAAIRFAILAPHLSLTSMDFLIVA